jgi:hypothetical protein
MSKEEIDIFAYMMAAEKMTCLVTLMDQTLEFMEEYEIEPDDEVRKVLQPLLNQYKDWITGKKQ